MAGTGNNFVPEFQLWTSDGLTKIYTFPAVSSTNMPQSVPETVEITNLRSSDALTIDGGRDKPFDGTMGITLSGNGYVEVTSKIKELEETVLTKIPYLLRIQRSETPGDYWQYNVKRILPFGYAESLRLKTQNVAVTLRVNSW
jgi:hypothetical protein